MFAFILQSLTFYDELLNFSLQSLPVTLSAPSKTFNIPVFSFSYVIAPNKKLKDAFENEQHKNSVWMENVLGL